MTRDEQIRSCLALGGTVEDCADLIESLEIDGVYCDGRIYVDEHGKRCISQDVIDRVAAARRGEPLPARAVVATPSPEASSSLVLLLIPATIVVAALYFTFRRKV